MRRHDVQRAIRRAILAAIASSGTAALTACSCPDVIVVSPLGDAAVPTGISGSVSDRQLTASECSQLCRSLATRCQIVRICDDPTCRTDGGFGVSGAQLAVACEQMGACPASGRRTAGFTRTRVELAESGPSGYFATMAELEAASVVAFDRLADELRFHGAPAALVARASRSAREETRHARLTSQLANAFGGRAVPNHEALDGSPRSLVEIAIENAVEGCVRETFGAAVAAWQAEHASDSRVRDGLKSIARDEARHAALSWDVARWIDSRLDAGERSAIGEATRSAIETLRCEMRNDPDARLISIAGLPDRRRARAMIDELDTALWVHAA